MTTQRKFLANLILIATFFVSIFGFSQPVFAQNEDERATGVVNFKGVDDTTFNQVNPLFTTGSDQAQALSTPGGIISRVLLFAFPIAGLILFVMILWGGFEMLMGASDKKSLDAGKQRITAAIIGFLLLFVSFWIIRVVETVFGIKVLF